MRSLEQIIAEQDTALQQYPEITTPDSTSDVSFYSHMRKMWALLVQLVESAWSDFRTEIELKIALTRVGSLAWYVEQVKAFQYGDQVSITNGQTAYDIYDPQKRIIAQAAGSEDLNTGRLTLRAAKKGYEGLVPLNGEELDALKTYIGKVKYAGVIVDVLSMNADELKISATVKVDRQVFSTTGNLLSDSSRLPVHEAIAKYLESIPYDSVLSNTSLTDAIQQVKGVKDFTISTSSTRKAGNVEWELYNREVLSSAGHLTLHPDSIINFIY